MRFLYQGFTQQPTAAQLEVYPAASLWHQLSGELTITEQGQVFWQDNFPLFRLAALLRHWLAYRPAPLDECRLGLAEYEVPAALVIRRQAQGIELVLEEDGRDVSRLTALEVEFNRAGAAFLEQLRVDVQTQLGVDIRPHLRGIPF